MSIYNNWQDLHNKQWSKEPLHYSKDNNIFMISVDDMDWEHAPDRFKRKILNSEFLPDYRFHPQNYITFLGIYSLVIGPGILNTRNGRLIRFIRVVK